MYIIDRHIMNHLDTNNILTDSQHDFRPKRSCESKFITTFHDNTKLYDRRDVKQVDTVIIDFAKALNKIPHKRLTLKLNHYGVSGQILH